MPRRRRSEPLRYQIRNDLLNFLVEEGYQPGDQIPTEQELVDMLDVSRSTLREGLHLLEEERIIRTKHGAGRFLVATPTDYQFDLTRLQSVTEMLAGYGIQVITQVVDVKEQPADAEIAQNLGLPVGDLVLSIERIRYAERVPIIYSIDILPKNKIREPWDKDMFAGSLLKILEKWGFVLDHTRTTIRVVLSDALTPRHSMIESRVPWILLEQVNYDREGEPIIYSFDYHRGDYITFHVNRYRH